jgi:hypothetical protein
MTSSLPMTRSELGSLLNLLLECERAGARLLAVYSDELPRRSRASVALRKVQRDEAANCAVLIRLLLEAGVEPTRETGDFFRKGLAVRGWRERFELLNRGQAWVARRIASDLPRIRGKAAQAALRQMHGSHLVNIAACERLFPPAPGTRESLVSSNAAKPAQESTDARR